LLGLPDALGELGPSPTLAQWWAERLGSGACGRRHALEAWTRPPAVTRADRDRVKAREPLRPLVSLGQRGAVRPGHPGPLGEAVDPHAFALPPAGAALAPTLARGKKCHRRRQPPNASARVLRPRPAAALAWQPPCQPSASGTTSAASPASRPRAAPGGPHTTDSPSSSPPTRASTRSETAQAASHDRAWAGPGARPPRTNAPLTHSTLQNVLPDGPPSSR
jgi:hypothetical protein